ARGYSWNTLGYASETRRLLHHAARIRPSQGHLRVSPAGHHQGFRAAADDRRREQLAAQENLLRTLKKQSALSINVRLHRNRRSYCGLVHVPPREAPYALIAWPHFFG